MLCSFEERGPPAKVHISKHTFSKRPKWSALSLLYGHTAPVISRSLSPCGLYLYLFHSSICFHAQHSQAMSWNKSICKTRLGCESYGRRSSFPGPDNSTFFPSLCNRIIPFCHARRQSKLWLVSLYLWHSYFHHCVAAATMNHLRRLGRRRWREFCIMQNGAHLQLLLDRFDANIKMHSHYQKHQKKGEVRGRMITSLCGARQWTQQGAGCQSRLFAMHSGQFINCSLDLMQICEMKSIYDDVEQFIEMQKANAVYLKNGRIQLHAYSNPHIVNWTWKITQ